MYLIGDKIMLMKPIESLNNVGCIYEVGGINDDKVIIRTSTRRVAICACTVSELYANFERVEEEKRSWTDWGTVSNADGIIGYYKTNGKRVKVKLLDGTKGESCCCEDDTFNINHGIALAYYRALAKVKKKEHEELEEKQKKLMDESNFIKNNIVYLSR